MFVSWEWLNEILRDIFWTLCKLGLGICDLVFDFTKSILSIDYLNANPEIWNWFLILVTAFTGVFVLFRVIKNFLLDSAEITEEREPRLDTSRIIVRLICLALVLTLTKPILTGLSWAASGFINNIEAFVGAENTEFSGFILQAYDIDATDYNSISINEKAGEGYAYLNDTMDFVFILIASVGSVWLMILIAFSVGNRFMSMLVKMILAPWSFSTIIERNPESFATWCKLFLADFFANFVTMFLLIAGVSAVLGLTGVNKIAQLVLLLGALTGILNAPAIAGQLIGADIGAATGMQSLTTLMGATGALRSAGGALAAAGGIMGNVAANAGAKGIYGIGRLMGGIDRHDAQGSANGSGGGNTIGGAFMNAMANNSVGGSLGNAARSLANNLGYDGQTDVGSGNSSIGTPAFAGAGTGGGSISDGGGGSPLTGGSGGSSTSPQSTVGGAGGGSVIQRRKGQASRSAYDGSFAHKIASVQTKSKAANVSKLVVTRGVQSLYDWSSNRLNRNEMNKYGGTKRDSLDKAMRN